MRTVSFGTTMEWPPHVIAETGRLHLRELDEGDAAFALELLNDADFLRHIGDKGVRTLEDARGYLQSGPLASYAAHGFGLWRVARADTGEAIGFCGLLKRDWLDAPDVGYAFLPSARGSGLAREAVEATLRLGGERFGQRRVLAIVSLENLASIRLLERVGFLREGEVVPPGSDEVLALYARTG
jgi:[ribosomal protein S5]-alanine N-acetyltransferase